MRAPRSPRRDSPTAAAAARGDRAARAQRVEGARPEFPARRAIARPDRPRAGPARGRARLRGRARPRRPDPRAAARRRAAWSRSSATGAASPPLAELGEACRGRLRRDRRRCAGDRRGRRGRACAHIVANLPYNVGTALLVRWLGGEAWPPWWTSLTLMFQQEVAERIVAAPGSGAYGRLSVLAQWRSEREARDEGPPLRLRAAAQGDVGGRPHRPGQRSPKACERPTLERLTAAAFGQRRKMLRQSLGACPARSTRSRPLGIDPGTPRGDADRRGFVALARVMECGTKLSDPP